MSRMSSNPNRQRVRFAPSKLMPTLQRQGQNVDCRPASRSTSGLFACSPENSIRSIVVPLDGSPHAESALPHAVAIACRAGARLRIVHTFSRLDLIDPWQMFFTHESLQRAETSKRHYLSNIARRIARASDVKLEALLVESADEEGVLAKATLGMDLVVMASRRRRLARRVWPDGAIVRFRRELNTPLLLVPGSATPVDLASGRIARHILAPLDGAQHSPDILRPAVALAKLEQARLTLLNVHCQQGEGGFFEHTNSLVYFNSLVREAKQVVPGATAHLVTTKRSIAHAVAKFASQHAVDLIALASGTDEGWSRVVRGSVLDSLLQQSDVPILVQPLETFRERSEAAIA